MGSGLLALLRARARASPPPPPAAGRPAALPAIDVAPIVSEALDGADLSPAIVIERPRSRHAAFAAVDAGALREALRALLRAAAAALPAGGVVRVDLRRLGARTVVVVADSGAPLGASGALADAERLGERCGARLWRASVPGIGNRSRLALAPPSPPPLRGRAPRESGFDPPQRGR
jgi:hypothetical protein